MILKFSTVGLHGESHYLTICTTNETYKTETEDYNPRGDNTARPGFIHLDNADYSKVLQELDFNCYDYANEINPAAPAAQNRIAPLNGEQSMNNNIAVIIELKLKGSVRERENGLIEFRSQQLGSTYGRDENEIKEKLLRKIRALKSHRKLPQQQNKKKFPLFSEFYTQRYLPYKQSQKRAENTLKGIEYNYKYIIEQGFDKPLNEYTAKDIKDFLFAIDKTRKRQIIQGMLNNLFKYAVSESLLTVNPCTAIEKMEHDTNMGTSFSFVEQARYFKRLFADKKISYQLKCYYIFTYLVGSRRNEGLDVIFSDADMEEKLLKVNGTKTDGSLRQIPLFPFVEKLLSTLTPNKKGRYFPFTERAADGTFSKFMKELGMDHKLHDLRHSFGTIQICCNKIDVKTVSLWMGHSNIETTLKYYTHPEQLDKATFLRGDLSEDEKTVIYKGKCAEVLQLIDDFLTAHTQNIPKN